MFTERQQRGSNLFEYVIPLALVGIVIGIAMFNIQQSGVMLKFIQSSLGGTVTNGTLEFGIETTGGIANDFSEASATPVTASVPKKEDDTLEAKAVMSAPPNSSGLYAQAESGGIMSF